MYPVFMFKIGEGYTIIELIVEHGAIGVWCLTSKGRLIFRTCDYDNFRKYSGIKSVGLRLYKNTLSYTEKSDVGMGWERLVQLKDDGSFKGTDVILSDVYINNSKPLGMDAWYEEQIRDL